MYFLTGAREVSFDIRMFARAFASVNQGGDRRKMVRDPLSITTDRKEEDGSQESLSHVIKPEKKK